ncbi:MAG: carboxypeptidase-like regulatory domain-containing protein [Flavobacteriaceae bacterium]|nr:carboxypeptidase-like regulatory domain-containing protein [Flavobacteriaceae bacterium]
MRKKITLSFLVFFTTTFSLLFAQSITVSGKVSDDSGNALPGVNIQVKGTSNGTSTDFDGNYEISASQGDMLIFSFLGFKTKEVSITGSTLNVTLEEDTSQLDEVVVTALGITREKKSIGYSVQQLSSEEILNTPQVNIVNSLLGKVAGAQISSQGGAPGQGSRITIRGVNSLDPNAENQPLFVVDGIPISNNTISVGGGAGRGMTNQGKRI